MKNSYFTLFLLLFLFSCAKTKNLETFLQKSKVEFVQYGPDTIHARGIQIFKNVIYTANSNGYVYSFDLKTKDKLQLTSKSYKELRDIHVKDEFSFAAMQSADTCFFIQSENSASKNFNFVSFCENKFTTFLDAFDLNKSGFGILLGDPVQNNFQVYTTTDFGKNWKLLTNENFKTIQGEAAFAASGTVVQVINDSTYYFVSGGKASNLFKTNDFGLTWQKFPIPFIPSEASGPFSMNFWSEKDGIVVGGDYTKPNDTIANCFLTKDGGITWSKPNKTTSGYKSCVLKVGNTFYAGGTNGIDISIDGGNNWYKLNSINTFTLTSDGKKIYATTTKGKIATFKVF